jgi:hypothetical protein
MPPHPPHCKEYGRQHQRSFQQFSRPDAETRGNPKRSDDAEDEPGCENQSEIEQTRFESAYHKAAGQKKCRVAGYHRTTRKPSRRKTSWPGWRTDSKRKPLGE